AQAATLQVWVSGNGSDANPCTATQPCATFQHAYDVVAAGGEIAVLSPGNYGPVIIGKSVGITNDGAGEAGIIPPAAGIFINATRCDVIGLRGLVLDGSLGSGIGIVAQQLSALHIQNCVIRNFELAGAFPAYGLEFEPTGTSKLFLSDSIIFNNGSTAGSGGVLIAPQGTGSADVVLHRVHLENNVVGLKVEGSQSTGNGSHVVIRN